jgi:hypothetical protein
MNLIQMLWGETERSRMAHGAEATAKRRQVCLFESDFYDSDSGLLYIRRCAYANAHWRRCVNASFYLDQNNPGELIF